MNETNISNQYSIIAEMATNIKIETRIKELETRLNELSGEIYDEWRVIKWVKYWDKEKDDYKNGGYKGFEAENPKCQEQAKLSNELKELKKIIDEKELEIERKAEQEWKDKGGVVVFVDGARNQWGGRYGITDENGQEIEQGTNGQISEQIEIEAYAVLKAVNWAVAEKVKILKIMTDSQVLSYGVDFKSKTKAGKYFWLARKIAKDENIKLDFEWVPGKENKADYLTRK